MACQNKYFYLHKCFITINNCIQNIFLGNMDLNSWFSQDIICINKNQLKSKLGKIQVKEKKIPNAILKTFSIFILEKFKPRNKGKANSVRHTFPILIVLSSFSSSEKQWIMRNAIL